MSTDSQSKIKESPLVLNENAASFLNYQLNESFGALSYLEKVKDVKEKMRDLGFYDWNKIAPILESDFESFKDFARNFDQIDKLLISEASNFKDKFTNSAKDRSWYWYKSKNKKYFDVVKQDCLNFQKGLSEKLLSFKLSGNIEKLLIEFFAIYTFSVAKEKFVLRRFEDFVDIYVEYMLKGNYKNLIYFHLRDKAKYKLNSFHSFFIKYNIEEEPQLMLNYLEYLVNSNQLAQARSLFRLNRNTLFKNVSKKLISNFEPLLDTKKKFLNEELPNNLNKSLLLKSLLYFNLGDLLKGFSYLQSIYITSLSMETTSSSMEATSLSMETTSLSMEAKTAAFIKSLSLELVKETSFPKFCCESKEEFIKEIEQFFQSPCKIITSLGSEGLSQGHEKLNTINSKDKNPNEVALDQNTDKAPLDLNETSLPPPLRDNQITGLANNQPPISQDNGLNRTIPPLENPDSSINGQPPNNNGNRRDPPNDHGHRPNPPGHGMPRNNYGIQANVDSHDFNILSIDGGGIKGVITLIFLRELEIRTGRPVYDLFQMFAGTSIGGLMALIFSQKIYTAEELLHKMMGDLKNEIFYINNPFSWFLSDSFYARMTSVPFLRGRMYSEENLERILRAELTKQNGMELTLENSVGNFLITCSELGENNGYRAYYFAKFQSIDNKGLFDFNGNLIQGFQNTKLADIGRATSAADPVFIPKIINNKTFIDGGFTNNNPSQLAYNFASDSGVNEQKIHIYSIGCKSDSISAQQQHFAGFQKYERAIDNLITSQNQNTNLALTRFLNGRFHRFCPGVYTDVGIDGISRKDISILHEAGMKMIETYDEQDNKLYTFSNKLLADYNKRTNSNLSYNLRASTNRSVSRYKRFPKSYEELNHKITTIEDCQCQNYNCSRCVEGKKKLNDIMYHFKFVDASKNSIKDEEMVTPTYWRLIRDTCVYCKAISIGYLRLLRLNTEEGWMKEHLCINSWTPFHFAACNNEIHSLIFLLKDVIFTNRMSPNFDDILEFTLQEQLNAERIRDQIEFIIDRLNNHKTSYLSFFGGGSTVIDFFKNDKNPELHKFLKELLAQLDRLNPLNPQLN